MRSPRIFRARRETRINFLDDTFPFLWDLCVEGFDSRAGGALKSSGAARR